MSSQNNDPLIGRIIAGKIRIDERLGAGATGSVYRADHLTLAKPVAIKVLHSTHSGDPNLVRRFRAEARAASRLDHPNSIRILDFGEEGDGLLYLAMEFLDGEDLQSVIDREGPLDPARVVGIMVQVSAALSVAHEQGIIHRDMKPGNIMLVRESDDGGVQEVVKVCDFGLAKILDVNPEDTAGGPLTKQGMIFGTPTYMSPEQASGTELDPRSDIYSCGVIMYRMITGVPPFVAESTTGMLMKHIMDEPIPVLERNPACDPRVAQIIERAMRKSRDQRYPSMKEMFDDLRAVLSGQPIRQATPRGLSGSRAFAVPMSEGLASSSRSIPIAPPARSPLAIAIIGSIALVLVGGVGTFLVVGAEAPPPPPLEVVAPPPPIAIAPPIAPPVPPPIAVPPPVDVPPVEAPPPVTKRLERAKAKVPERRVPPPEVVVAPPPPAEPPPPVEPPPPPVEVPVVEPPPVEPPPVVAAPPPPPVTPPPPAGPKKLGPSFDFGVSLERLVLRGGISTKQVQAALSRSLMEMKPCLRGVVAKNGVEIAGGVDVKGAIGARGRLQMVEASGGVSGASSCVEESLRTARMPPADTGDVYLSFRIAYVAGE